MRILNITLTVFIVCFLTLLTQIGGIVYIISFATHNRINNFTSKKLAQVLLKSVSFMVLYCLATFAVVPIIASPLGRVRLPITETHHLKPLTILTCLLNRNYVKPELRQTAFEVAIQMNHKFPGTSVNFLDGNFPFINKFPLIPHLSHNDGKKLDLAFCYRDAETGTATNKSPSFIGYGICEEPLPGENNTANFCAEKGYWQYSFLTKVIPQGNKQHFLLDTDRTKELVNHFAAQPSIGKIFIEPHLVARLNLLSNKIRFHGCQAVRHDDHIHIQLK